jgi:hypothetical protein
MTHADRSRWTPSGRELTGPSSYLLAAAASVLHVLSLRWLRGRGSKNESEAREELRRLVSQYESLTYDSWLKHLGQIKRLEFTSASGIWYQATVESFWDDEPGGALRVMFSLDDGGSEHTHRSRSPCC